MALSAEDLTGALGNEIMPTQPESSPVQSAHGRATVAPSTKSINTTAVLFASALLLSAALLFLAEPMFAKMALPLLGGTAAVWNTCIVFFQMELLLGYAYAHCVSKHLGVRWQAILHVLALCLAFVVLPIRVPANWMPPNGHNPIPWLLMTLLVSVGPPFFVLATMSPTLQGWYSRTGDRAGSDPYFLYAVSNVGSMLALLSYPVLIEPHVRLLAQGWLWTFGYAVFFVITVGCIAKLRRRPAYSSPDSPAREALHSVGIDQPRLAAWQRVWWSALAFVPSSLMLGVTTTLTTDFPPIPLFWVVPLAIYLLTFILVFARKPPIEHELMVERAPFLILMALFPIISKTEWPVWMVMTLDLLALFVISMVCHGALARSRPSTRHLTEFYLWLSFGGVAGGVFNAIIAPLLFNRIWEYPLVLVFAALLLWSPGTRKGDLKLRLLDFLLPLSVGGTTIVLIYSYRMLGLKSDDLLQFLIFTPPLLLCLSFGKRPVRFALGVAALLLSSVLYTGPYGHELYAERSFFGVYRVSTDAENRYRLLLHGSTLHGMQSLDPRRIDEPLAYYSRTSPIGEVFAASAGTNRMRKVAIVGLGSGCLAAYGRPGQKFTFYEIDPTVERIARNGRFFTFLRDSAAKVEIVLGDARLSLRTAPDRSYDLIVLDAFNSDSIPLHLLTREAISLYLAKLAPGGVLAFNISNRYLELRPVIADLASDAGLFCVIGDDSNVSPADQANGKKPSLWALMARRQSDVPVLNKFSRWTAVSGTRGGKIWTDDFSNILSVIRWSN